LMTFGPIARFIAPLAVPEATVIPLTFTVALAWAAVGVTVMVVVVFATLRSEERRVGEEGGGRGAALGINDARSALALVARVTACVYVLLVESSRVVIPSLMTFGPTARFIAPLAAPEATVAPLTFTVALAWATVGVTVMVVVVFATL